jgi:inosine/xanthosine triphosphate pyrophosphatase family protein
LEIDGQPHVEIKWELDVLRELAPTPATWRVTLAHHDGQHIRLFVGQVHGTLVCPQQVRAGAFGFDPFFRPQGQPLTLDELEQAGAKDSYSARRLAAQALVDNTPDQVLPLSSVNAWSGAWQCGRGP